MAGSPCRLDEFLGPCAGFVLLHPIAQHRCVTDDCGGGINVAGGTLNLSAGAMITNNAATGGDGGGIIP